MCHKLKTIDLNKLSANARSYLFKIKTGGHGRTTEFLTALAGYIAGKIDITDHKFKDPENGYLASDFAVNISMVAGSLNEVFHIDMHEFRRLTTQLVRYRVDVMLGRIAMNYNVEVYVGEAPSKLLNGTAPEESLYDFKYHVSELSEFMRMM
jgi:hypothetical protein